jgi:hypothetical protein
MLAERAIADYGNRVLYLSFGISIILMLIIIQLVRKRQLTERFALAWMVIPIFLLMLSFSRKLLDWIAALVGIYYPPAIMIPILFLLFLIVSLYFSVKVSMAEQKIKTMAQDLALLRHQVENALKGKRDSQTEIDQ